MYELLERVLTEPDSVMAMTAVLAVLVASGSLIATLVTLFIQRQHNRKSVVPVAEFVFGDYENHLEVALENKGLGPLRVDQLIVTDGKHATDRLVSRMPEPTERIAWSAFTGDISGRWLSPGERIVILKLEGDDDDPDFSAFRDEVRRKLGKLEIAVHYSDVYSKPQPSRGRGLNWFLRNLPDSPP